MKEFVITIKMKSEGIKKAIDTLSRVYPDFEIEITSIQEIKDLG